MNIKGVSIKNCQEYIEDNFGKEKWSEIFNELGEGSKKHLPDGDIFPGNWYPIELFIEINEIIQRKYGEKNRRILRDAAKYGAMNNMKGIYRIFLKIATPEYALKRASMIFSQYFDEGTLKHTETGKDYLQFQLDNVDENHVFFERFAGFVEGILASTSAKASSIEYKHFKGEKRTVFDVYYKR